MDLKRIVLVSTAALSLAACAPKRATAPKYDVAEPAQYLTGRVAGALWEHDHHQSGWGPGGHVSTYVNEIGDKVDVNHDQVISYQEIDGVYTFMFERAQDERAHWNQRKSFEDYVPEPVIPVPEPQPFSSPNSA